VAGRGVIDGLKDFLSGASSLSIGHVAFAFLVVGGIVGMFVHKVTGDGYLAAIAGASGLLAVGHVIRHHFGETSRSGQEKFGNGEGS
jgi:hypothetical protein